MIERNHCHSHHGRGLEALTLFFRPPEDPPPAPPASQITSPKAVSAGKKPSWSRPELKHFLPVGKRREPPRDQGPELGEALPHLQWSARRCLCVCGLPRPRGARGEAAHTMVQPLRKAGGSGRPQPRARRRGPAASRPWCVPYCALRARHGTGRRFASLPARPFPRQASPGAAACTPSAAAGRSPPPLPSLCCWRGEGAAFSDRAAIVTFPRRVGTQPSVHRRRWRGRRRLCVQTSGTEGK